MIDANQRGLLPDNTTEIALYHFFEGELLPKLREGIDLQAVLNVLRERNYIDTFTGELRHIRVCFDLATSECDVFMTLKDLIMAIQRATGQESGSDVLDFVEASMEHENTEDDNGDIRYFGVYASLAAQKRPIDWTDVAIPAKATTVVDVRNDRNVQNELSECMRTIMHEDIQRRFVLGFTMEGCYMRLWYANRSHTVVSVPFDIAPESKYFVELFLRLSYAHRDELGWDDTIQCTLEDSDGRATYTIPVGVSLYETQELICDHGSQKLGGRGTRVWEVKKFNDEMQAAGHTFALKDSWVDEHRPREGAILRAIHRSATTDAHRAALERHCPLVVEYGDVWDPTHPGQPDSTRATVGLFTPRRSAVKIHHRIVYMYVGQRLSDAPSLREILCYLQDVVCGLRTLHECGWVHRDVSSGNILVIKGKGVITDFEYAQHKDDPRVGRVGTKSFMSTEVAMHAYLYGTRQDTPVVSNIAGLGSCHASPDSNLPCTVDDTTESSTSFSPISLPRPLAPVIAPFRYNPLHDLESVYWLTLYFMLRYNFISKPSSVKRAARLRHKLHLQTELAMKLSTDLDFRIAVMREDGVLAEALSTLLPPFQDVGGRLDAIRIMLVGRYPEAERQLQTPNYTIGFDVAHGLYDGMIAVLQDVVAAIAAGL